MTSPGPEFWEYYQNFMKQTFENMQKMVGNMGGETFAATSSWPQSQPPQIHVDEKNVIVAFPLPKDTDRTNIRVFLEGSFLVVEGSVQYKTALPGTVQKYGGKAVCRRESLEVVLPLDRYGSRSVIPLEIV